MAARARWWLLADAPIGWSERAICLAADAGCLPPPGLDWTDAANDLAEMYEAGKPAELAARLLAIRHDRRRPGGFRRWP